MQREGEKWAKGDVEGDGPEKEIDGGLLGRGRAKEERPKHGGRGH